jgi:hypothetical protein
MALMSALALWQLSIERSDVMKQRSANGKNGGSQQHRAATACQHHQQTARGAAPAWRRGMFKVLAWRRISLARASRVARIGSGGGINNEKAAGVQYLARRRLAARVRGARRYQRHAARHRGIMAAAARHRRSAAAA